MNTLLLVGITMMAGLIMSRAAKLVKLPNVTAFLVAGLIIGPCVAGVISKEQAESMGIISEAALGFIAYSIGGEFKLSYLKKIGKAPLTITFFQGMITAVCVDVGLILFGVDVPLALLLGAIGLATAPAATLMVVRQYKAKGKVTDMLLPVVALDDAVGLVLFAIAIGIARGIQGGAVDVVSIVVNPLLEILGSLVLGSILGYLLNFTERFFHSNRNRLTLMIAAVSLATALSMAHITLGPVHIGFSALLTNMMMGTVFCNRCAIAEDLMDREDKWTAPVYCLFFVLSGAALRPDVFSDLAMVGVGAVYILFRSAGKYFGAGWSARATGCDKNIVRYLGITLLPQAGVALGMSLTAQEQLGADGLVIRSITLFSVLVYELVGPALTKAALIAAGEIRPERRDARTGTVEPLPQKRRRARKRLY